MVQINPWNIVKAVQDNPPLDVLQQKTNLQQLQNLQNSGVLQQGQATLQNQQIQENASTAQQQQANEMKQANIRRVLQDPKAIGPDGTPTDDTFRTINSIDPTHGAALMKAFGKDPISLSTIANQQNEMDTRNATRKTAADTLAETIANNKAMRDQAAANRNIDPNSPEGVDAAIRRSQGEYHPPVAPRNIDPLSPEGLAAQTQLERTKAALKPAADSNLPPLPSIIQTTQAGRKYIDASQVEPKTLNELQIAAAKSGVPVVNKDTAGILTEIDTAKQNLDLMMQTLKPKLASSAATRPFTALNNTIQSTLQSDDDLAAVGTYRNAAIQAMRAVAGAKGLRINRAEIELAIENDIPKITDTVGAAQAKIAKMGQFLENMEKAHLVQDRSGGGTPQAAPSAVPMRGGSGVVIHYDAQGNRIQ